MKRLISLLILVMFVTVAPILASPILEFDKDLNRIADSLEDSVAVLAAKGQAEMETRVIITLTTAANKSDGDIFRHHGGKISHRFSHVLHGYAGTIPADQIASLAQDWGPKLSLIEVDGLLGLALDTSVPQIRARPLVWDTYGFEGDPGTTIGIFDTGLDMTHPDLAGKLDFWHDFNAESHPEVIDLHGHGTFVAGIACGTGAVHEAGTVSSIGLTGAGGFPSSYISLMFDIPVIGSGSMTTECFWTRTDTDVCFEVGRLGLPRQGPYCSGSAPFLQTWNVDAPGRYEVGLSFPGGFGLFPTSFQAVFPYTDPGDGHNLMTGVASGCRLAGVKVFSSTNNGAEGSQSAFIAACDSMAVVNQSLQMKVANASIAGYGSALYNATVGFATSGTVFVVAAGNDYGVLGISGIGAAPPALCVGAVNDLGYLTSYSSRSYNNAKPDVVAPGGSRIQGVTDVGLFIYAPDTNWSDGATTPPAWDDMALDDYSVGQGTSFAAPHVAGLAALVIEALESKGYVWNYTREDAFLVKSIILMTATETNLPRENNVGGDPPLNRGSKDGIEGYGMVNADAAIEAVLFSFPDPDPSELQTITFGSEPSDRRCWAAALSADADSIGIHLTVPSTLDADIYIYTPHYIVGDPLLLASSINDTEGDDESLIFVPQPGQDSYLVIKRISGFGTATLNLMASSVGEPGIPQTRLVGNFPNPFNPRTTIKFNVGQKERVTVSIYDVAGRQLTLLEDRVFESGPQEVTWQGCDKSGSAVASGTYFVRMESSSGVQQQKMMLVR